MLDRFTATWGTEELVSFVFPSMADDPAFLRWRAKFLRASASPRTEVALYRSTMALDIRSVLPTITIPTLVLHKSDFALVPLRHGRYLADHMPGAKLLEVAGRDDGFFTEGTDEVLGEVAEFLTAVRPPDAADRMLATILFTDIVGSTEAASRLGDRRWRALLESHLGCCVPS